MRKLGCVTGTRVVDQCCVIQAKESFRDISVWRCAGSVAPGEGADHQWRRIPPGELSIDPVADERPGRATRRAGAS